MKYIQRIILTVSLLIFLQTTYAQDFLKDGWKQGKTYLLLAHPTVQNIETIDFLVKHDILKVKNVEFIGVYPAAESYDYSQSVALIHQPGMSRFHLQEVQGREDTATVYTLNGWSKIFQELFDHSDGIFFFGGPDIQPELYGQKNLYAYVTDPNRHAFECSFLFHLLGGYQNKAFVPFLKKRPSYFVTGFCLGLQSMNVATGGTLIQDIPAQRYNKNTPEETLKLKKDQLHRNYWPEVSKDTLLMGINFHPIEFTAHPFFTKKVKADKGMHPMVLSSHHQAIEKLGKDFIVTATSLDGQIIEGIHHRLYPNVFAVQFHPEVPSLYEQGQKLKFAPTDQPTSYYDILSEADRKFHLKYWQAISKAIKASVREKK
ncbi:MAG TPA: gamma-glutamyl-gamma-aminobutyrate hydrolase family protein [Prolixibacteraceae bacterium]|nr:gamma-glutamyl-gamma-aminobutyrate hydrolase family protein [Prolixibacteraceae bacterium]